jgi:hypothetical protein
MIDVHGSQPQHGGRRRRQRPEQHRRGGAKHAGSQRHSQQAGQHGNQQPFGQQLTDHASAARAEREADGDLAMPPDCPREHHVRHVGAGGHEHEAEGHEDRRPQRQQPERQGVGRSLHADLGANAVLIADHGCDGGADRALRLRCGDTAAQAHADLDGPRLAGADQIRRGEGGIGLERHPHVTRPVFQARELAQHADDNERTAVDVQLAADDVSRGAEQSRPGVAAQHDGRHARLAGVAVREGSSEQHARTERLEVIAGDQSRRQPLPARRHGPCALGEDGIEEVATLAQLLVVAPAERPSRRDR